MSDFASPPRRVSRLTLAAAAAIAGLAAVVPLAVAQDEPGSGWTYSVESLATGVNYGYQLGFDPAGRQVYFTDAQWRVESRAPDGTIGVTQTPTGKVVVFDAATRDLVAIHSFLDLSRNDGSGPDRAPLDWSGVTDPSVSTLASNRTTFSPYGIAIDGTTVDAAGEIDPTIVTTTARGRNLDLDYGGHLVVYNASQGAPTDADRLWEFEDGTPIFDGIRRIAVNTGTHTAFVTNFAEARAEGGGRPGFVAVVDLEAREVVARVRVPELWGAIGVTVDEERDLVYVGTLSGDGLYVIDAAAVDTGDPQDLALNDHAITELEATVGENARPTYDPVLQRVYVSAYDDPAGTITVVDADPESPAYGTVIDSFETGPTNAVAVDGERGLLYSANLGAQEVVVYDTGTHEELLRLPTSGNALNIGVDPVSHEVWVSNYRATGVTDVFSVHGPR